jgi:hypothetical protein
MQQEKIHSFLERYFQANECEITENDKRYLDIQLTIELDKLLMNRPFYWHYLEKTGGVPNPMRLSLITDPDAREDQQGEFIHFGSPRLHQIFQSTKQLGAYIRLFENATQQQGRFTPLGPWIGLNIKVSYQCDRKKDQLLSIGLHLISGQLKESFHDYLEAKMLSPKIPDYCYTLSPLIKPESGLRRIEAYVESKIADDDHTWADEARKRWQEDEELLNHFYDGLEEKPECYHVEKKALETLYKPKISVDIINGGMFYLT